MVDYSREMLERKFIFTKPIIAVAPQQRDTIDSGNLAQLAYGDRVVNIRYE